MADLILDTRLLSFMAWLGPEPGAWVRFGRGGPGVSLKCSDPLFSERQHPERVLWQGRRFRLVKVPKLSTLRVNETDGTGIPPRPILRWKIR